MTLLAALCSAVLVYLVAGALVGIRPQWQPRPRSGLGWRCRLTTWLDQSETAVGPEGFVGVALGSGLASALVAMLVSGVPALNLLAGLVGGSVPVVIVQGRRSAISQARRAAWPDALRDIATRLRSGASMHSALSDLGRLGPVPLRTTFARYEVLASALDHRVALETVRNELAEPLADRIIEVLLVAFDQGSRVVIDILDDLATSAVADLRLMADIDTAQLETKLEARGASVLPFVVLALLCLGSDGYRSFYASRPGTLVILLGFAMSIIGIGLIGRLGRVEAEPRSLVKEGGPQ